MICLSPIQNQTFVLSDLKNYTKATNSHFILN